MLTLNYFMGLCHLEKRINVIVTLVENGSLVDGIEPIRNAVFHHFRNHFKVTNGVRPGIDNLVFTHLRGEDGAELVKHFSLE